MKREFGGTVSGVRKRQKEKSSQKRVKERKEAQNPGKKLSSCIGKGV